MEENKVVQRLLAALAGVEHLASGSRLRRLLNNPIKYATAMVFLKWTYRRKKQSKAVQTTTFFGLDMHILLPSSTDIYLTGGKSHASETRLARFMLEHLSGGDTVVDVGAHYGYFALLASQLVGESGRVLAFEAAPNTYTILEKNAQLVGNIQAMHLAVSDVVEALTFYEFPNLYSEYNTMAVEQFENEEWFKTYNPRQVSVMAVVLDSVFEVDNFEPKLIKIDVEGAEDKVVNGMKNYLNSSNTMIAMEYLSSNRGNVAHARAAAMLESFGYSPNSIDQDGQLVPVVAIDAYLTTQNLDSDNIVFVKQ